MDVNEKTAELLVVGFLVKILIEIGILFTIYKIFNLNKDKIILLLVVYFGVRIALWLKESIVAWISFFTIIRNKSINTVLENFITKKMPNPVDVGTMDPELYFKTVTFDESYDPNVRILSAVYYSTFQSNRMRNDYQNLYRLKQTYKGVLDRLVYHYEGRAEFA